MGFSYECIKINKYNEDKKYTNCIGPFLVPSIPLENRSKVSASTIKHRNISAHRSY
jgi:hypothetical protein